MTRASVYRRDQGWYIGTSSQTTVGVWLATEPRFKVSSDACSSTLGLAVTKALEASREGIPHPTKWDRHLFKPMLDLAGVKSWREFSTATDCLNVSVNEAGITFEPCKNAGPKDGYTFLPEKNFSLPADATPEAIGDAVKRAIALCE